MTKEFKKGEAVSWNTSQGKTEGKVVRKQTSPTKIKSHEVEASKDDPQYIVQSTKSGNKAAHHPERVMSVGRDGACVVLLGAKRGSPYRPSRPHEQVNRTQPAIRI